jgi:hypothetical protein
MHPVATGTGPRRALVALRPAYGDLDAGVMEYGANGRVDVAVPGDRLDVRIQRPGRFVDRVLIDLGERLCAEMLDQLMQPTRRASVLKIRDGRAQEGWCVFWLGKSRWV